MELFRIIKGDAKRAVRFCGGRSVASAITVALVWISVSAAETLLTLAVSGYSALFADYREVFSSPKMLAVAAFVSLLWLLVIPALLLGYIKLHLAFAEGRDESIGLLFDMFSSAKKFFGSILFSIMFCLRYAVLLIIAIAPAGALFWFSETWLSGGERIFELLRVVIGLFAASIITLCVSLGIVFSMRWSLAPYYFAAGNGIHRSFVLSAKATKGRLMEILSFRVSFIGWGILSLLIVPMVFTLPYYSISNAIYAEYLMERYRRSFVEVPEGIGEVPFTETD